MPKDWLTEDEACACLEVTIRILDGWRVWCAVLRRAIKSKPRCRGSGRRGYYYWASDIADIKREVRPYAPFKDKQGRDWIPRPTIVLRYPRSGALLGHWNGHGCPLFLAGRSRPESCSPADAQTAWGFP